MNYLMVFLGGGAGSVCRYAIGLFANRYLSAQFPFGTFISNLISCIILGFLIAFFLERSDINPDVKLFLVVGFCGGFSTYAAFTGEIFEFIKSGSYGLVAIYVAASLLLCFVGFITGYELYRNSLI